MTSKNFSRQMAAAVLTIVAGAACGSDPVAEPTPVVTAVAASIAPGQSGTSGPFDFTGTITATGATSVRYRWELSNGELQDVQVLQFGGAGSLTTSYKLTTSLFCIGPDQQMWARLSVLEPNVVESAKVTFTRNCLEIHPL